MERDKVLKELQEVDLKSDRLQEKKATLPEKEKIETLNDELSELDELIDKRKKELSEEESQQKKLEGELEILSLKIKKEEQKLYSGTIVSPKELADIQKEVSSLKGRSDKMETELLEQLEVVEKISESLEANSKKRQELSERLAKTKGEYEEKVARIEAELQELKEERDKIFPLLSSSAAQLYEDLRDRKHGVAVTTLKAGVCQGCHVKLPAEEVDKMLYSAPASQEPGEFWFCSNCGRILIKD